jgi:hypothetical protein
MQDTAGKNEAYHKKKDARGSTDRNLKIIYIYKNLYVRRPRAHMF